LLCAKLKVHPGCARDAQCAPILGCARACHCAHQPRSAAPAAPAAPAAAGHYCSRAVVRRGCPGEQGVPANAPHFHGARGEPAPPAGHGV
jgi:hypothetical protein